MNSSQVLVRGILKPDGILELTEKPALPPGPVEVVIRALPATQESEESWWEYLQQMRAEMLAQGVQFRSRAEIDADRARDREQDLERDRALEKARTGGE